MATKTKKNSKENLKEMKMEDLNKKLSSLKEELRVLHFKAEGSRSKNVKEGMILRRQIARVLTELNSKNKN
jgi:ribosomal protein L29